MNTTPKTEAAMADYLDDLADFLDSCSELEVAAQGRLSAMTTANRKNAEKLRNKNVVQLKDHVKRAKAS